MNGIWGGGWVGLGYRGLGSLPLSFCFVYSWCFPRSSGWRRTLPGLYTPWTFPKPAAMEKYGPTSTRAEYTSQISSG